MAKRWSIKVLFTSRYSVFLLYVYAASVIYDKFITFTIGFSAQEGSIMINMLASTLNWASAILTVGLLQIILVVLLMLICSILRLNRALWVLVVLGVICNISAGSTWLFQVDWYIQFAKNVTQLSVIPLGIVFFSEFTYRVRGSMSENAKSLMLASRSDKHKNPASSEIN